VIVECPRCRARYRVESGLLERDQTFKCSRCSNVFAYQAETGTPPPDPPLLRQPPEPPPAPVRPAAPPEPSRARPEQAPDGRKAGSLSFTFSKPLEAARAEQELLDEPTPPVEAPTPERSTIPPGERDYSFDVAEEKGPEFDEDPAPDEPPSDEPRFVRGEEELRIQHEEATNPTRPYLLFLGMVVVAYAILTLDFRNHPARAERLLSSVPMLGDVLAQDHLLQIKVHLQDVEGAYQEIKEDKTVFIVSGRAVNTWSEPVKGVQIESGLYDRAGQPIETRSIYCGNAMSLKVVKDLSAKEILLLQRLEPPKRFEIRPGESAAFSVVFLAPPAGLGEFTTRVVAAQSSAS
jgi:predicted Zn finger-like uncharacterized protein